MGTRAVYTFREDQEEYHVYKHWDGYPSGACQFIKRALDFAWPLPRFEADEFAAAFVCANKMAERPEGSKPLPRDMIGGNIHLMQSGPWQEVSAQDIEYRYEISHMPGEPDLVISAYSVDCDNKGVFTDRLIFTGTLSEFELFTEK